VNEVAPLPQPLPRLVVGPRISLDVWRADKVEEVRALVERSQHTLSAFLPWAASLPSFEDESEAQVSSEQRWREGRMAGWMLVEGGAVRGMVGLHRRGGPDELEIGYWLDDAATGRGLMTEACTMATDVAFGVQGIEFVEIIHDRANRRSEGVPARLGYRRVAAFTSTAKTRCETGIKVRWSVRRDEWLSRGRAPSVRSTR
jgi:ribosomal-protein-serine acetyltransferase